MRALVTGSAGLVGSAVVTVLQGAGWSVGEFDIVRGDDLLDAASVRAAVGGCDVVVHAGAIPHDDAGTPDQIVATNVLGTWHVLHAAETAEVERVVYFSSGLVFGVAEGEGTPDYLPVDDDHPRRATRPYGLSKRLAEDMCEAWSGRTGRTSIVLRPVWVLDDAALETTSEADAEYGSFVHLDDVADAARRAVEAPFDGHVRLLLSGAGPFDTSAAERVLGWRPRRGWT